MKIKRASLVILLMNMLGFLGTLIVNALAVTLPLNNKTTEQLSDQYPNLFVPAGLTFSIWGVIYILLGIFVIYQAIVTLRKDANGLSTVDKVGYWFFLLSLLNMGWIFAWQYEIVSLSVVIMLMLLGCLLTIYLKLNVGYQGSSNRDRYLVHLPFSVYLGWISVATIANVTTFLVDIHWTRFGLSEQFWAVAVIVVAIALALSMLFKRQDIFYCLVVDWALLGILLKRLADATPVQSVIVSSLIGIGLLSAGVATQIVRRRVYSVHA